MIVDAHHHLWDPRRWSYGWMSGEELTPIRQYFGPEALESALDGTPVDTTVMVQAIHSDEETEWFLEVADSSDLIAAVVGWVDLRSDIVSERLGTLLERSNSLRGIRHQVHDEPDPEWLLRPDVVRGLRAVQEAGLGYDLLIRRPETPAAERIVAMFPALSFIIDHSAKPSIATGEWDVWRAGLHRLAQHDHVTCKISGLVTEASWVQWREQGVERYIHAVLEEFGADRCMFGSDWPVSLLAAPYREVFEFVADATSALSEHEREALFGATAARVYRLDGAVRD